MSNQQFKNTKTHNTYKKQVFRYTGAYAQC